MTGETSIMNLMNLIAVNTGEKIHDIYTYETRTPAKAAKLRDLLIKAGFKVQLGADTERREPVVILYVHKISHSAFRFIREAM